MNEAIKFIAYEQDGQVCVLSAQDFAYMGVEITHAFMTNTVKNFITDDDFIGAGIYSADTGAVLYGDNQEYAPEITAQMNERLGIKDKELA